MKKSLEMKNKLEGLKQEAQNLLDQNKVKEAQDKMEEVKNLKAAIIVQEDLEKEEEEMLALKSNEMRNKIEDKFGGNDTGLTQDSVQKNASFIRAALKKVTGKSLTEAENALLLPTSTNTAGANGESYILPQDIRTLITKKMRQYKSIRDVIGYMPVGALSGSFPIENFETVTELVDFEDGTDGAESNDIKFTPVSFKLKEKAAFIKLSNTLLMLTDNALINYIVDVFSKKAIVTENKMGLKILKSNKTPKAIAGWKELKSSINKDLDPAALYDTVIVTNQDGFDVLDASLDGTGRPILQPNPTDPTQMTFKGYPIIVYSNSMIPTDAKKAPIIYGNLKEAAKILDLNGNIAFATSSEAGFMSNTTVARLIEFVDVVQVDASDKCYVYGEIALA